VKNASKEQHQYNYFFFPSKKDISPPQPAHLN